MQCIGKSIVITIQSGRRWAKLIKERWSQLFVAGETLTQTTGTGGKYEQHHGQ